MVVISSNAPYYINVYTTDSVGEYKVYLGNSTAESDLLYSGKVNNPEGSNTTNVPVNLQPIFVNYVPSRIGYPEGWDPDDPGFPYSLSMYQIFTVVWDGDNSSIMTEVIYMLPCTENATNHELGWDSSSNAFPCAANDYIQKKFINGTYFSTFRANPAGTNTTYLNIIQHYPNGDSSTGTYVTYNGTVRASGILILDSSTSSFDVTINGLDVAKDIEVLQCAPDNTYILYYVNTFGAIDYIICDKNNSVTYNADRHTMTQYADIMDRAKFGKVGYLNNTTRTWTLNTDIMSDEQSKQMYKVFNSPYMWLYDVDKQEFNSVVLEDANLKIKRFATDKIYNYTIKVTDSQTFTIQ